jgi:hypothetical protein
MANANVTVGSKTSVGHATDMYTEKFEISALSAGLRATLTHTGPTGTAASEITYMQTAPATDGSPVSLVYAGTDTTNNEIDLEFTVPAGGSLDGATFTVWAKWIDQARQDGQSINSDNG